jgi:opacity protein-like surface antigen
MKKIVLLTVVAGLFGANIAMASGDDGTAVNEEPLKKGYFALKVGRFNPNTDYGSTTSGLKNFDSDMNYEVAFGSRGSKYFAFDLGLGYYTSPGKKSSVSKVSVYDATVSAIGILPISSVDLFAGIGAGVYYANLKDSINDTTSGAFGYQFLGGADINITNSIAIGGEVKYSSAKPEYEIVGTGSKLKLNVGGTTYSGVIKFRY